MLPKISIITPSFNQGLYIEQTIKSILDQGYPNLEYIVIDGGSTDNTVSILKKYDSHLAYWVSEPDKGQAHAINKGLERCTGDIVNWINSDDFLEPGALMAIANNWIGNPKANVFCGYTHCFWEETGKTSHTYRMGLKKTVTDTLLHIEMNQPGTFYRTEVLKSLGGVNDSLRYVFDNELWMRYLCAYGQDGIKMIDQLIAHFRLHGSSKSVGDGFTKFNDEQQSILGYLGAETLLPEYLLKYANNEIKVNHYKSFGWDLELLDIEQFHAWFANKYMVSLYNDGKKTEAKYCLIKAIKKREIVWCRKNLGLLRKMWW